MLATLIKVFHDGNYPTKKYAKHASVVHNYKTEILYQKLFTVVS